MHGLDRGAAAGKEAEQPLPAGSASTPLLCPRSLLLHAASERHQYTYIFVLLTITQLYTSAMQQIKRVSHQ